MRRLLRLLATLVGMLPCELREAIPVVGDLVASCCADDDDGGSDHADCCATATCLCAVAAVAPAFPDLVTEEPGFLLLDLPSHLERPTTRAGPPPTPPPIG